MRFAGFGGSSAGFASAGLVPLPLLLLSACGFGRSSGGDAKRLILSARRRWSSGWIAALALVSSYFLHIPVLREIAETHFRWPFVHRMEISFYALIFYRLVQAQEGFELLYKDRELCIKPIQ